MSGGGRPPNSAPSLPLHSSSSGSLGSLQTPDTSSLFLSSLGSHARPRTAEFTSLEDLLNFSGIAQQTSSLEVLARDLEQKGGKCVPQAQDEGEVSRFPQLHLLVLRSPNDSALMSHLTPLLSPSQLTMLLQQL